jgi:hypothetical protein
LRTWFLAVFFVARHKQGISALQFQRDAGLGSYKTARTLLHKVRSALAHNPLVRLEGDVEVDETYIGGYRPGRNGRGVGKTGVAIAVERREKTAGSMRLIQIPNATRVVLNSFVETSIRPNASTVFTDAWGSYKALAKLGIDHRPRKGGHGRPPLARGRTLRLRPTPRRAWPAAAIPTPRGGGKGIGRVLPIPSLSHPGRVTRGPVGGSLARPDCRSGPVDEEKRCPSIPLKPRPRSSPSPRRATRSDNVMLYLLGIGAGVPQTDANELEYTYEKNLKVLPSFGVIPTLGAMGGSLFNTPGL